MVTHPVILRGAGAGTSQVPLIVKRTDQQFIPAILDELTAADGLAGLAASALNPAAAGATLELMQPVHRTFNVALLDVACDVYGRPRLDPARIEAAGLVVRRIAVADDGRPLTPEVREGWIQAERTFRGWVPFDSPEAEAADPDPEARPSALRSGNPNVDWLLAQLPRGGPAPLGRESVAPLFVAPPAVCEATGRTLLYGLVPVVSPEVSEQPPRLPDFDLKELRAHLPPFLRAGASFAIPRAGETLSFADAGDDRLRDFGLMLRQLKFEFGAFDDSARGRQLLALLNGVRLDRLPLGLGGAGLPVVLAPGRPLGDFLREASRVLVDQAGRPGSPEAGQPPRVTMPVLWPVVDEATGQQVLDLVHQELNQRLGEATAGQGRFDAPGRQYRLRAFVRVRREDGCPPVTVWSDYSPPFTIAPWYANSELPPVQVALPNVLDPATLRQLKPNVAFTVPRDLFNFLQANDPKKLMDGEGGRGQGGPAFDWICSFNLPIITLCAFIVLNIFLSLFDLIFRWLIFIKICVPFPRRFS